ncbi:hypothetical protein [Chitinophaga sp. LS1]|uniref:hypothetical protein n=1 Tax=Chitinophaga sp. LS1 TaxID=3051176 RepID=UPI002AABCFF6|nr:hypothetical protein [Chitinophaga sp. LS1]WPV67118.1 hypothetical protein QQL36_00065 [Chitinophaga sp. LS1]
MSFQRHGLEGKNTKSRGFLMELPMTAKKGQYRTEKVNFVFARIARLQMDWIGNEKGTIIF